MTMTVRNIALLAFALAAPTSVRCFQPPLPLRATTAPTTTHLHDRRPGPDGPLDEEPHNRDRRRVLAQAAAAAAAAWPLLVLSPSPARAGIDVSGLRQDTASNDVIAAQLQGLKFTDVGTAGSRVRALKEGAATEARGAPAVATPGQRPALSPEELGSAGTYARTSGGAGSLRSLLPTKINSRYTGFVEGPAPASDRSLPITFDFPTDWLRLDRQNGGLQYVDQRNGSKLYVLRAPLPPGQDLASVPKSFFDDSAFDLKGDVVRFGTEVGAHRTARSEVTQGNSSAYLRRRLQLNYETLSGNGVQTVERRGLLDAIEIGGVAYMMLATCNAVKFEKKGSPERATVELIVDSFRVGE